jgi:AcrR family transcriptional regulator
MTLAKILGKEKKEEILDVAENLFSQFGFEAVSVRQLAKEASINVAMVSYYFGSKEQLFKQVIERKLINTGNLIASSSNLDCWDKIFLIANSYIDGFFQNRTITQIIYREINLNQRLDIVQMLSEHLKRNFGNISLIISEGIDSGVFRKVDIELTVMTIIGVARMYAHSPTIACKIFKEKNETDVFSDKYRRRLKNHMKEVISALLKP